jgi:glutathione S-transferase
MSYHAVLYVLENRRRYTMGCLTSVYIDEVDPYKKPQDLLDVSPKGLVPALKLNKHDPPKALNESTVILEYLEELRPALIQTPPHGQ